MSAPIIKHKNCKHNVCFLFLLSAMLLFHSFAPLRVAFAASTASSRNVQRDTALSPSSADDSLETSAKSAILIEAQTGTVIFEKNADERLRPASVTKIMTLLLIFEALEKQQFQLQDLVTVSEHAASMGGSQVFLEPGETQSVDDMIKCISIARANDASVAMAEFVAGSETSFVDQMNTKAQALGMKNTTFKNCCGLEADGHLTTARDIALMSRELLTKHPQIRDYCTIWQDSITHETKRGSSEFGLTNTNKFLKQYPYATGLKTGYTSLAKYCISASAAKDSLELITVLMAEPDISSRVNDLQRFMDYGFSRCALYEDANTDPLPKLSVSHGASESVALSYEESMKYLDVNGRDLSSVKKELSLPDSIEAPVQKGDIVGKAIYTCNDTVLGTVNIRAQESVERANFLHYLQLLTRQLFHNSCYSIYGL